MIPSCNQNMDVKIRNTEDLGRVVWKARYSSETFLRPDRSLQFSVQ